MIPDHELLRQYSEEGSQDAFTEVVHRNVDLVYSVAVRVVGGDRHLAEDITQRIFTDLARQAGRLSQRATLAGWLHVSARNAAVDLVRRERRRRTREKEAAIMNENSTTPDVNWEQLQPIMDEAVARLKEPERNAVVLRFFQDKSHREIGDALGVTENAARMRVERALDKLRRHFSRRGVTLSSALLATAISANSVQAAPTGLAAQVAGASLAQAAKVTLGGSLAKIFAMTTKAKALIAAVVIAAAATIPIALQYREIGQLNDQLASNLTEKKKFALEIARDGQQIKQLQAQLAQFQSMNLNATGVAASASANPTATATSSLVKNIAGLLQNPLMKGIIAASAKQDAEKEFAEIMRHFSLSAPERDEFLRLLTERQINLMDPGIQLMDSTQLSPDERAGLLQRIKDLDGDSDAKIKTFLNNDDDYAYYETYNKEKPEREQIDALNALLDKSGQALNPTQADALLNLMYQERSSFKFTADLSNGAGVTDPGNLSKETIATFLAEKEQLQNQIADKAAALLSPEQLDALKHSLSDKLQSQAQDLETLRQMFGSGK